MNLSDLSFGWRLLFAILIIIALFAVTIAILKVAISQVKGMISCMRCIRYRLLLFGKGWKGKRR